MHVLFYLIKKLMNFTFSCSLLYSNKIHNNVIFSIFFEHPVYLMFDFDVQLIFYNLITKQSTYVNIDYVNCVF